MDGTRKGKHELTCLAGWWFMEFWWVVDHKYHGTVHEMSMMVIAQVSSRLVSKYWSQPVFFSLVNLPEFHSHSNSDWKQLRVLFHEFDQWLVSNRPSWLGSGLRLGEKLEKSCLGEVGSGVTWWWHHALRYMVGRSHPIVGMFKCKMFFVALKLVCT